VTPIGAGSEYSSIEALSPVGLLYFGTVQAEAQRGRDRLPNARLGRLLEAVEQRFGRLLEENEQLSCVRGCGRRIFVELIRRTGGVSRWAPGVNLEYLSRGRVMTAGLTELSAELQAGPDSDAEELAQLGARLRGELLDLDVVAVEQPAHGEVPEDSKGVGMLAAGELIVRLMASPEVLASIIAGVRSWLGRNRVHSVKLTLDGDVLEVRGTTSAEQDRLIDLWVTRHAIGT